MTVWKPPSWGNAPPERERRPRIQGANLESGPGGTSDGAQPNRNPRPTQLRDWRRLRRNTLRGFAAVTVPSVGVEIDDVAVHVLGTRRWVSLPGRPMIDQDGVALRDEKGKIRYVSPIRWMTHGLAEKFGRRVIELVLERDPRALDGDER